MAPFTDYEYHPGDKVQVLLYSVLQRTQALHISDSLTDNFLEVFGVKLLVPITSGTFQLVRDVSHALADSVLGYAQVDSSALCIMGFQHPYIGLYTSVRCLSKIRQQDLDASR